MKNLIRLTGGLILISGFLLLTRGNALAYNNKTTHPDLTREVIIFYELSTGKKLADEQKQWIIQGSIDEDLAPRWLNHFYDPVYERGLTTDMPGINGYLAKNWAQFSSYQTINIGNIFNLWTGNGPVISGSEWGDFSYEAAIKNYSQNKEKEAYLDLGHVLHLIEDMTVPEHTRNDSHPGGNDISFYEKWTMQNSGGLTQDLGNRLFNQGIKLVIYGSLGTYFNNLATYTDSSFFSPDTIKSEIYPKPIITFEDGTFAYGKDENNKLFDLAIIIVDKSLNKSYSLNNPQILQEYWLRLSRQVITNGAGIINLFLNQVEAAKQIELAKQKVDQNSSSKSGQSLLGFITKLFTNPGVKNNQPALVINSEPMPAEPQVKSAVVQPKTESKPAPSNSVLAPTPTPNPIPAPIALPIPTLTPASAPTSTPVSVPTPTPTPVVVYGGGGGGSSNTTPQATEQAVEQTFAAGVLVINEIMYDLGGDLGDTDTNREWIEIYNNSSSEVDLTNWKFNDGDDTTNHGLNVPPDHDGQGLMILPVGGYLILAEHAKTFLITDHLGFSGTVIDVAEMNLKNASSTVTTLKIIASDGTTIDEVTYYNSWGASGDGKTLERRTASGGSNDAANWGVSSATGGTPGAANNPLAEGEGGPIDDSTEDEDGAIIGNGTDISATTIISEDTIWTLAGGPYRLFFDSVRHPTVMPGATLTIEAGAKIIPQGGGFTALEIQGTLNALATFDSPIIFTSINDADDLASTTPQKDDWLNIVFSEGSQGNLDYVNFRYGGQGITLPLHEMVNVIGATVNINHSKFENSQGTALHLVDSTGVVENSIFSDNTCGISVDSSNGVANTTYGGCYGIHTTGQILSSTELQIRNNQFIRNRYIGVEVRSGTAPTIDSNIFTDNGYPIKIESSYPVITNSQLVNSTTSPNILNGIAISGYTHFSHNFTLKKDLPYISETNGPDRIPCVDAGITLTLEPGVIIKPSHTFTALNIFGNLVALGTPDNPIVFTSFKNDSQGGDTNGDGSITSPQDNDWAHIKFFSGGNGNFANAIFSFGGYGYIAPPTLPTNEVLVEGFDNYLVGALSGQGDWSGGIPSDTISVANSSTTINYFVHNGANSVKLSGGSGAYSYRALAQPIAENGALSFWIYYNSLGNQGVSITDNPNNNMVANVYYDTNQNCSTDDGNCFVLNGARTVIQTTTNVWHYIEIETDLLNHQVKMRQDGGIWSDWTSAGGVNIGRIRFDRGYGDIFYDTFAYSMPSAPASPVLSIDAGATVVVQ